MGVTIEFGGNVFLCAAHTRAVRTTALGHEAVKSIIPGAISAKEVQRNVALIPASAHGTNPASAAMNGFKVVTITSKDGLVDLDELDKILDDTIAGLMLTNPNTLGLYDTGILEIDRY